MHSPLATRNGACQLSNCTTGFEKEHYDISVTLGNRRNDGTFLKRFPEVIPIESRHPNRILLDTGARLR